MWSNLKSNIPADTVLQGRPYGGTGFICKPVQHCTFHNVPQEYDRISVIEVLNNNRVVITLIGVFFTLLSLVSQHHYTVKLWTNYMVSHTSRAQLIHILITCSSRISCRIVQ